MSPIPINASLGMALSLLIAFTVTPWLALKWMKSHHGSRHHDATHAAPHAPAKGFAARLPDLFGRILRPFLNSSRQRWKLLGGIVLAMFLSVGLAGMQWVIMKMLPFDNKSEFQVVVDMPAGTPLENTAAALQDLGVYLSKQKEVLDVQTYAGTASPITFNGLVRQYYLRADAEQGDLQVNLVGGDHTAKALVQLADVKQHGAAHRRARHCANDADMPASPFRANNTTASNTQPVQNSKYGV
jgi:multidrug efflux pump subunit AcrB